MGWDIQINPHAQAHGVSRELVDLLDPFLEDFEMRYAALEPNRRVLAALRAFHPATDDEKAAVAELITRLAGRESVELFLGN